VPQGRSLTFRNLDSDDTIWHTITACKEPCNKATGVAYPLANGRVDFDSGELGFGPKFATAAANRDTWSTPRNLNPGTYTYFCRVHPFMRGAFKVRAKRR
jgi:plastocyanin